MEMKRPSRLTASSGVEPFSPVYYGSTVLSGFLGPHRLGCAVATPGHRSHCWLCNYPSWLSALDDISFEEE